MSVSLPTKAGSLRRYGGVTVTYQHRKGLDGCELCTASGRFALGIAGYPVLTERVRFGNLRAAFCRRHALEMVEAYVSAASEREEKQ